ncbi:MAG: integrase family protein [Chromatiales bacterium]|nr:integrase family protein [Chromatiales bacterium]
MILRILKDGRWIQQRLSFGRYPSVTLAEARAKAVEAKGQAERFEDPGAEARAAKRAVIEATRHTFAAVRGEFLVKYRGRGNRRPAKRTLAEVKRVLESDLFADWSDRPLSKITRRDVLDVLDVLLERGAEVMANRTLAYLSMLFGWALHREIIESDPTESIKKPGVEQSRERVLTLDEMRAIWQATEPTETRKGDLFDSIVKVLMLTGQRRDEVAGMRWSEVDLASAMWTLPADRTKNHREHLMPLNARVRDPEARQAEQAVMGMATEFVFTSFGRDPSPAGARASAAWMLRPVLLPGPCMTFAAPWPRAWPRICVLPHVIEATINHVSGVRSGVAGTYNRALYLDERRAALDAWAGYVLQVVGVVETDQADETDNVVKFPRKVQQG